MRITLPSHGHQLSHFVDDSFFFFYTGAASDGPPAPRLLFDGGGIPYLVYADRSMNTRVARLRSDFTIEREVFFRERAYPADAILADNGLALLLLDFEPTAQPAHNYHSIRLVHVTTGGAVNFEAPIVGTRSYAREGDQGIDSPYEGTAHVIYKNGRYTVYFNTRRLWDDGITHQSEYLAFFEKDGKRTASDVAPGFKWNVSHSLRLRIAGDEKSIFTATIGDMYPRGLVFGEYMDDSKAVLEPRPLRPGEPYQLVPISTGDIVAEEGTA